MEKKAFTVRQISLTKDNEELKLKFSQLLDQFQEYFNDTEQRLYDDQTF
jgi:hypothetical protein